MKQTKRKTASEIIRDLLARGYEEIHKDWSHDTMGRYRYFEKRDHERIWYRRIDTYDL